MALDIMDLPLPKKGAKDNISMKDPSVDTSKDYDDSEDMPEDTEDKPDLSAASDDDLIEECEKRGIELKDPDKVKKEDMDEGTSPVGGTASADSKPSASPMDFGSL